MKKVFRNYAIDADRLATKGFSDEASYALSLGITNADLFSHVIAFSPGFLAPGEPVGEPSVFISQGTDDQVLPIDATSRKVVPLLQERGYDVEYVEFDGGHIAAPHAADDALAWFLSREISPADPDDVWGGPPC